MTSMGSALAFFERCGAGYCTVWLIGEHPTNSVDVFPNFIVNIMVLE